MQSNKIISSLFALTLGVAALACTPGSIGESVETEVEPTSTTHEVYFQDPNGTQVTLGYYDTETRLLQQASLIDEEYAGFLFQTAEEIIMIEGSLGGTYEAEITLDAGTEYDAYVWLDMEEETEPVALGTVVMDATPIAASDIDAIYGGSFCSTSREYCKIGWTGYFRCRKTYCRGGYVSESCRRVLAWQC